MKTWAPTDGQTRPRPFVLFLSWSLLRQKGSVTIRGVSTKLKVNSGRTSPTVNFQQEASAEKSENDPSMVSR